MEDSKQVRPVEIVSVGFLIDQKPDFITLAQSIAADTQTQGRFMIPTSFIKSVARVA
jgi:hypothetical protein